MCVWGETPGKKGLSFILFAITAADVVPCGGPTKSPRISSIVQIIFSFWSFEISEDNLRNQIFIIGLDSFLTNVLYIWLCLDNTSLLIDYIVESCNITVFHFGPILPHLKGQRSLAHPFSHTMSTFLISILFLFAITAACVVPGGAP